MDSLAQSPWLRYIAGMPESPDSVLRLIAKGSDAWASLRNEFVEAQDGHCAICLEPLTEPKLDHCHVTGFIRGALCGSCNIKLGWYEKRRREIETYLSPWRRSVRAKTSSRASNTAIC